MHAEPLGSGPHAFRLATSAWAPGVYIAQVETGGEVRAARFVIAR